MSKLLTSTFEVVAILGLNRILDGAGNRVLNAEDRALVKFDFSSLIAANATRPTRSLSLFPVL